MTRQFPYRFFQNRPATAWAALLLLLMLLLRLLSGFNGLYGQDSYAYLLQAQAWLAHFKGGIHPPAFFWPEGYPILGALLGWAIPVGLGMQLISMLSAAATLYFAIRLGRGLFPAARHTGAFLFLVVGLSPWGLRSGMLVMSDSLGVALLAGACWWAWSYWKGGAWRAMAGAAVALGLAVSVRYPLALPGLLAVALVAVGAGKRRDVLALLFPLVLGGLVIGHFALHNGEEGGLAGHHFLGEWAVSNWFRRDFTMQDGEFHYRMVNLVYALGGFWHPGLVGLGCLALVYGGWRKEFWKDRRLRVLTVAMLAYMLFLAGIPFQNPRFLLPILPLAGLLYLPVWGKLTEKWKGKWVLLAATLMAVVHLGLIGYTSRQVIRASKLDQEIANWPTKIEGKTVYTFGMDGALKVYRPEMKVLNLWDAPLDSVSRGAWLLFNEEAFREQWKGKNPMLNYELIRTKYDLREMKRYQEGWVWHEIK